jgi:FkbM family methyltransferase
VTIRLRRRLKHRLFVAIATNRRAGLLRFSHGAARAYLRGYDNINYDMLSNGEARVLACVGATNPTCLFDVGANVGDWARQAVSVASGAKIHCFEIVPDTAAVLRQNLQGQRNVVVNPFGLAAEEGDVAVEVTPGDNSRASTVPLPGVMNPGETIRCPVMRGDDYCRQDGISHIDMLKIDTEGGDYDVLRGFEDMLSRRAVDVIQFEYGLWSIWTKHLLIDHHALLANFGYLVGKVFPTYVDFRTYDPAVDEDFRGPNYLAVRAERSQLIDILGGGPR